MSRYANVGGTAVPLDGDGAGAGAWWARPVLEWSAPAAVAANASAHVKGAWVEVIASTPAAMDRLDVSVYGIGASLTNTASVIDIGIGSAGAETVIVPNVAVGGAVQGIAGDNGLAFSVPVYVPSGSRVAVRMQSLVTGGKTATVRIGGGAGDNPAGTSSSVSSIGASTSTSAGTSMSVTNDTYVELTASTAASFSALTAVPSVASTSVSAAGRRIIVATGPAGAEVDIGEIDFVTTSQELLVSPGLDKLIPVTIAAGSRLAARMVGTSTNTVQLTLLGVQTLGA